MSDTTLTWRQLTVSDTTLTWRQLIEALQELPDERLDDTVTVFDFDQEEYHGVWSTGIVVTPDDVLETGALFLLM